MGRIVRRNAVVATGSRQGLQLPPRRPGRPVASSRAHPSDSLRLTERSPAVPQTSADAGLSQVVAEGGSKARSTRKGNDRGPPPVEESWKILRKEVKAMRAEHLHSMGRFDTATARLASVGQLVEATSAHCKNIADAVADLRRKDRSGTGAGRTGGNEDDDEPDVVAVSRWFRPVRVRFVSPSILVFLLGGTHCCVCVKDVSSATA